MTATHNYQQSQKMNRLAKSIPKAPTNTLLLDQKIPNSSGQLHSDLCLLRNDTLTMVDVTIPYEGDADTFVKAKRERRFLNTMTWLSGNAIIIPQSPFILYCGHLGCLGL